MEEGGNDGRTFYYCPRCPYPEECNEKCFKKWECWGWTEEAARKRVLDHLKGSGLHKEHCSGVDDRHLEYEEAVEGVEILQDIHHEQPEESAKKRRKKANQNVGADTFAEPRAKSAAAPRHDTALARRGSILDNLPDRFFTSGSTPITRQDLQKILDCVNRCVYSARQAQKLSAMAAQSFAEEATVFEEIKAVLEAKVSLIPRD